MGVFESVESINNPQLLDLNKYVKSPTVKIELSPSLMRFIVAIGLLVVGLIFFKPFKRWR